MGAGRIRLTGFTSDKCEPLERKSETRRPRPERRPKSEIRGTGGTGTFCCGVVVVNSAFGFLFGSRVSSYDFRISARFMVVIPRCAFKRRGRARGLSLPWGSISTSFPPPRGKGKGRNRRVPRRTVVGSIVRTG